MFSIAEDCELVLSEEFETNVAPYGASLQYYSNTFKPYSFEFENVRSSYPADGGDEASRNYVVLQLVDSVVLAKHLGPKKLAVQMNLSLWMVVSCKGFSGIPTVSILAVSNCTKSTLVQLGALHTQLPHLVQHTAHCAMAHTSEDAATSRPS